MYNFAYLTISQNDTFTLTKGSFLLFCMIIAFLRDKKRKLLKRHSLKILEEVLLSEYLLDFLNFYGQNFNITRDEISMANGGVIRRKTSKNLGFSLLYPQENNINIGEQAFKVREVLNVFRNRYNFIMNYKFGKNESVLKFLVNPSNRDFSFYLS